jgi:lipopolysaccharide/colanic/teichoic acid biosynthesis glycosyltransferase
MRPDNLSLSASAVFPPLSPIRSRKGDEPLIRITDIVISLTALVILAPVFILATIFVYLTDPGPIFFAHRRLGREGRLFPCLKFRTMVMDAEERLKTILAEDPARRAEWALDHKLRDDPRITVIGKFLRSSSIDELPQLFNVLRGDMSLVGPRPIVEAEIVRYGRYYQCYCAVRPGITGLWQISGRNDVSYRRRVAMDVTYSRACCFKLNMKILVMTIPSVLMAKGSY